MITFIQFNSLNTNRQLWLTNVCLYRAVAKRLKRWGGGIVLHLVTTFQLLINISFSEIIDVKKFHLSLTFEFVQFFGNVFVNLSKFLLKLLKFLL